MAVRDSAFDPKADFYSLSFIFTEVWLVSEGAVEAPGDLITMMGLDYDKAQGVQFMRCLVWEVVRMQHTGSALVPRIKRHFPVSWLGAWALPLGFRDYKTLKDMHCGLPCLRPKETDMLEVARLWARIAKAAEDLPGELTIEQAQSTACQPLVTDMVTMLRRLKGLSHLEDAGI